MKVTIFEGNGDGQAMDKLAKVFNINYTSAKGYFVDQLTVEGIKVINLDGKLNGKQFNHLVIVEVIINQN